MLIPVMEAELNEVRAENRRLLAALSQQAAELDQLRSALDAKPVHNGRVTNGKAKRGT